MMQTFIPYLTELSLTIGWCLLHSLWQAALIWMVLSIIFRAFPAMGARLKHGSAMIALLLLACWVTNTGLTQWDQFQNTLVQISSDDGAQRYTIQVPPHQMGLAQVPEGAWMLISNCMPWLMLAYGLGLLFMSVRFGASIIQLKRLRGHHSTAPDEQLIQLFERLKLQMGISQQVVLRLSTRIAVPMVVGVLRPLILLPVPVLETLRPGELEAILLHELAHVSRADFLINLLLSAFETLFFFNPFVWRISGSIRRDREHCCDDLVVAFTGQPLTYARVLASLAECRPAHSIAVAATGRQPHLLNRIKRIIEMKNQSHRYGQVIAACSLAALLLTASIICFSPSFAQQSKKNASPQSAAAEQSSDKKNQNTRIVIVDSNGSRREYKSFDELPVADQEKLQADIDRNLKNTEQSRQQLEQAQKQMAAFQNMHLDSITSDAMKTVEVALNSINWNAIGQDVDSAMKQVASLDWAAMRRDMKAGLEEAKMKMADTKWKEQLSRETARASRELALATRNIKLESQRSKEQANRDIERAERRIEEARQEMIQARDELKRLRRENSSSAQGPEKVAPPALPAPPSGKDIPAPPAAPPSMKGIPAPPARKEIPAPPAHPGTVPAAPGVAPAAPMPAADPVPGTKDK